MARSVGAEAVVNVRETPEVVQAVPGCTGEGVTVIDRF